MSDDTRYDRPGDGSPATGEQPRRDDAPPAGDAAVTTETASSSGVATTTTTDPGGPAPTEPAPGSAPAERGPEGTAPAGTAPAGDREVHRDPSSEQVAAADSGPGARTAWGTHDGLLPDDELGAYQRRWDDIQVGFIDQPRQSVRSADDLVGEITHQIAQRFTDARQQFEQRWDSGDEPTTEELRQALQRYRDFFQRLVAR